MIHYLKIENFGPVKEEVEMNFEATEITGDDYEITMPDGKTLLKLGYIYGANASGKTTVLKAFDFLRKLLLKPYYDKSATLDFEPFLFRDSPSLISSRFELSFYVDSMRYVYDISFTPETITQEKLVFYQSAKSTELFSRSTETEKRLAKIEFGSKVKVPVREKDLLESNTLHNNTVLGAYTKTNVDIEELEKLNRWFNVYLAGVITSTVDLTELTAQLMFANPGMADWMNVFLNKADHQISSVNVADENDFIVRPWEDPSSEIANLFSQGTNKKIERPKIQVNLDKAKFAAGAIVHRKVDFVHTINDNNSYLLSILSESNGTKRYFGLGGLLYDLIHRTRLLCIDELETSLHPDLMKHFLQIFLVNSKGSQMLITTHNTSLMENQDFLRRDALWFSEKGGDGSVSLYSAAEFDSTTLRKDASLINAYRAGKLGAKPNLGSPYINEQ